MTKFDLKKIEVRSFIFGEYRQTNGGLIEKISPIDGKLLPSIQACSVLDVNAAVLLAEQTFRSGVWSHKTSQDRKEYLLKFARLIELNLEYLAFLDTIETGRPYANFIHDSIPKAIKCLRWLAECSDKLQGKSILPSSDRICLINSEPLGVVAAIVPWNDPLVVAIWKIAPALLMGNSLLLKPAEEASYSLIELGRLANDAGIPSGVLNILPGHGEVTGKALATHTKVQGVFFTGSSAVGKQIMSDAGASNMKRVGLECGGKSAFIVSNQCSNLQLAASTLAKNMFYNQGQICSAPSRLLLNRKIEKEFLKLLLDEVSAYQPCDPWSSTAVVGAICSKTQFENILGFIKRAEQAGIKKITKDLLIRPYDQGYYLSPTIFVDVQPDAEIAQNEIFGPVLIEQGFDTLDEAISLANSTRFGLAASIWSDDLNESLLCARALEAGIVHVNSYGDDDESAPFGGIKESGIGKDKSMFVFEEYSNLKTTWIRLSKGTQ
jgi:acyl-CoA reductase-like NAD-dependent aldehyde dehydrogenase